MKKLAHIDRVTQASIFPAMILWCVIVGIAIMIEKFIFSFGFKNLGFLFLAISGSICFIISYGIMNIICKKLK